MYHAWVKAENAWMWVGMYEWLMMHEWEPERMGGGWCMLVGLGMCGWHSRHMHSPPAPAAPSPPIFLTMAIWVHTGAVTVASWRHEQAVGLCASTSTLTGTCRLSRGKTCNCGPPVCRYPALKLPASTGIDLGMPWVPAGINNKL